MECDPIDFMVIDDNVLLAMLAHGELEKYYISGQYRRDRILERLDDEARRKRPRTNLMIDEMLGRANRREYYEIHGYPRKGKRPNAIR